MEFEARTCDECRNRCISVNADPCRKCIDGSRFEPVKSEQENLPNRLFPDKRNVEKRN